MLAELVVSTVIVPPAEGGSSSVEALISTHDLHSYSSVSTLKRSSCSTNGLAVTASHIFAAQADKATINVYNRTKSNLEATIPLPEKITALACSKSGGLVATGTVSGRLSIWETASGRYTSTALAHFQKVTVITFDHTGNIILTGSEDSNVLVWSVPHFLDPSSEKRPWRTLENHQAEITSIVCGKGSGPASIALTASKDSSVIAWNPLDGTLLRTFVFLTIPASLAMDPADRAFYVGHEDGTIAQVEFAKLGKDINIHSSAIVNDIDMTHSNPLFTQENRAVPVTISSERWSADGHSSSITSMGIMFEGTYLVTGNTQGVIAIWDVATGLLFKTLHQAKAPISSLKILQPTGFQKESDPVPCTAQSSVVPPRYHNVVQASGNPSANADGNTSLPPLSISFVGTLNGSHDVDAFGISSDMNALEKGMAFFKSQQDSSNVPMPNDDIIGGNGERIQHDGEEDKKRILELEDDLRQMQENYERLSNIQKKTWEEHVKLVGASTTLGSSA